jgi:hypothetical protein
MLVGPTAGRPNQHHSIYPIFPFFLGDRGRAVKKKFLPCDEL